MMRHLCFNCDKGKKVREIRLFPACHKIRMHLTFVVVLLFLHSASALRLGDSGLKLERKRPGWDLTCLESHGRVWGLQGR